MALAQARCCWLERRKTAFSVFRELRDQLERLGYRGKVFVTSLIGHSGKGDLLEKCELLDMESSAVTRALDLVRRMRPRLAAEFRRVPDEELIVDGVFVVARTDEASEHASISGSLVARLESSGFATQAMKSMTSPQWNIQGSERRRECR